MNAVVGYKPVVSVTDVLDAGACFDGVCKFVLKHGRQIVVNAADFLSESWVQKAAVGDGDGGAS